MPRVRIKHEQTIAVNVHPELQRLLDLCADLDQALVRNRAERTHLEKLRSRAEHMLREIRQSDKIPD